jgi:von Willebrand factor A domain-containing protein 8
MALLRAFAPSVPLETVERIATTFGELRALNDAGVLSYPFSAREAVAIVKHLNRYPDDAAEEAVEDILGFDGMNPHVRSVIAEVFQNNGFAVTANAPRGVTINKDGTRLSISGGLGRGTAKGKDDGNNTSKPKFDTNMPKFGKVDEKNTPHVGGTWLHISNSF